MEYPHISSRFPGFDNIYLFREPGLSRAFRANLNLSVNEAFSTTRRESSESRQVIATWSTGSRLPSDIIWTEIAASVLISERVVGLLESIEAKGWSTYEVNLYGDDGKIIAGYYGLSVSGRCGPINNDASTRFDKIMPGGRFPWWRGLFFDESTWDGSQLFMPVGRAGWIFVVGSTMNAFKRAGIKNVEFVALSDIERSEVEMGVQIS